MKLSKNELIAVVRMRLDAVEKWQSGGSRDFVSFVDDLDEAISELKKVFSVIGEEYEK